MGAAFPRKLRKAVPPQLKQGPTGVQWDTGACTDCCCKGMDSNEYRTAVRAGGTTWGGGGQGWQLAWEMNFFQCSI